MCRILYAQSAKPFDVTPILQKFQQICKSSTEYQGHGWGLATFTNSQWVPHRSITPIWEDTVTGFEKTNRLIVHARSAFQDEGIVVENNMPFCKDDLIFIFNGELRGVRIKEDGRIGAEKIFNYISRFDKGDRLAMLDKGIRLVEKQTRLIKAANIIIADNESAYLTSLFSERPEYFTVYEKLGEINIICSDPLDKDLQWAPISNRTTKKLWEHI